MVPDFQISSDRLTLKILQQDDSESFSQLVSNSPTLHEWIDWCTDTFDIAQAQDFIRSNRLNWIKGLAYGFGLYTKKENQLIGMVAITERYFISNSASLGYWVADEHQRSGYASEAMTALIMFGLKTLHLTRLEIICDPKNLPSHQVALSCGGVREGVARNRYIFQGQPRDGLVFSIIS